MKNLLDIFNLLWSQLLNLVDLLLLSLSTMSLADLLKWMIVLIVIMIVALGFLNAVASVVNHSLTILRRLFRYISILLGIFIVVFWVFTAERPCMFTAESRVTSCLTKDQWAQRQAELKAQEEKKSLK